MPYRDRHCEICGEFVKGYNFFRHRTRNHGILSRDDEALSDTSEPDVPHQHMSSSTTAASTDCIRDAVMCMLRRTSGLTLPDSVRYLSAHFPDIPSDWRIPIIVSTFSAAQKVAATYAEAVLGGDEDRTILAKRSMMRWIHGISSIEPGRSSSSDGESRMTLDNSSGSKEYSPRTNYLLDRCLPVPLQSSFQRQQLERDMLNAGNEVSKQSLQEVSPVNEVLMSVAAEAMVPDVRLQPSSSTTVGRASPVIHHLLADKTVSTDGDNNDTDDTADTADCHLGTEMIEGNGLPGELREPSADTDHTSVAIGGNPLSDRAVESATIMDDAVIDVNKSTGSQQEKVVNDITAVQPSETAVPTGNEDATSYVTAADARSATEDIDHDGAVGCFFDEILDSFNDGDGMIVNPLPTLLTPLQTPVHNAQYSEETVLRLHPSPNSALEESITPISTDKVRSPVRAPERYQSKGKRGSPQRKNLSSSISRPESGKENVKRTSDEEDPKSRKRSKGSSTASVTNDRTGNDDRPKFKIPLKPVQDRSIKQSNGFGRQISVLLSKTEL